MHFTLYVTPEFYLVFPIGRNIISEFSDSVYKQAVAAVYISCASVHSEALLGILPVAQWSGLNTFTPVSRVQSLAGERDPEAIKYSQKKKKHFDVEITHLLSAKKQHLKAQHLERGDRVTDQGGRVSGPVLSGLKLPPPGQTSAFCLQYLFGEQGFFSTGA